MKKKSQPPQELFYWSKLLEKEGVNFLGIPNHKEFGLKEFAILFSQIGIEFYIGLKNWFREGVVPQNEALPGSLLLCFCLGHCFLFAKTSCFLAGQVSI